MMRCTLAFCLALAAPLPAVAHPHIFVETALRLIVDEAGVLEAVEVSWTYDELYSLLVLEDMGLDADADMILTQPEQARINGFDMQWVEGFAGDLYITQAGSAVVLGKPEPVATELGTDGRITTRHRRSVGVPAAGALVQTYDPTYYTAYDLGARVEVTGACQADITPVDLDAAYTALEELLYGMPQDQADDEFPEVGEKFADKVVIRCGQ